MGAIKEGRKREREGGKIPDR